MSPSTRALLTALIGALTLTAAACSGSSAVSIATQPGGVGIATLQPTATSRPNTAEPASATAEPAADTATPEPTATEELPAATPVPAGPIQFSPAQIVQGGFALVYLTEEAGSATLHFRDRVYPMLHNGSYWWTIVGVGAFAEPGLAPATISYTPMGEDESTSVTASVPIVDRDYPVENIELDPETASLLDPATVNAELDFRASIFSGFTAQQLSDGPFQAPAGGSLSSVYGEARSYNGGPVTDYHHGTDFVGDTGDPVYAAQRGAVVFAGELTVRGNAIIIDHGSGVFTTYNHLSAINVEQGETVETGELIGAIGSTGLVTGPHLHWEVVVRGVEIDGELWLAAGDIEP